MIKYYLFLLLIAPITLVAQTPKNIEIAGTKKFNLNDEVKTILANYHVNSSTAKLEEGALKGMLASLNDSHTKYIDPTTFTNMQNQLETKSAQIGIEIGNRRNKIMITTVHPNSPADKAGLKVLDELTHITGIALKNKPIIEIETLLLGEPDSRIDLTIRRSTTAKPVQKSLQRRAFAIQPIHRETIFYDTVGYIKLDNFLHPDTDKLFEKSLKNQVNSGIKTIILDLRSNSGGLLKHALAIGSQFNTSVPLVSIQKKNKAPQTLFANGEGYAKNLNVIVIVNEGTASSAEILASALRQHNNAILIGTETFGKASVQQIFPLQNGGALVCTIANYKTAEGFTLNQKGLKPSYEKKVSERYLKQQQSPYFKYNYETDDQLLAALNFARLNYR